MKFWEKFKIKFKKNKRYRIYMILGTAFQITAGLFFLLAFLQKDDIDNIDKVKNNEFQKEILKSTKETEFNTASERFFRENNFDKSKYKNFFKYGYTVYRHSLEFDRPFKKSYGSELLIDYSEVQIIESNDKEKYVLRLSNNFRNTPGNSNWQNNLFEYKIIINLEYVNKIQILRGIGNYGLPQYSLVDCFILLNNGKPYTYAIGPQDSSFFERNKN